MGESLIRRERKEGTEKSKVLRYASTSLSMVRGAEGNGINGETFLKLKLLLGWSTSLSGYYS